MRCEYKFWYIKRDDDGFITEAAVRFYEGDYVDGKYVRTKRLEPSELIYINEEVVSESTGKNAILFNYLDFGRIKTDDELRKFLNKEIKKDTLREPVDEQKEA